MQEKNIIFSAEKINKHFNCEKNIMYCEEVLIEKFKV